METRYIRGELTRRQVAERLAENVVVEPGCCHRGRRRRVHVPYFAQEA